MKDLVEQNQWQGQSKRSIEDRIVSGIFAKFALMYGTAWAGFVADAGGNVEPIKRLWAIELGKWLMKPDVMRYVSENLPQNVPSLPAFRKLCEQYKSPEKVFKALPQPKLNPEKVAKIKAFLETREAKQESIMQTPKLCAAYVDPQNTLQVQMLCRGAKTSKLLYDQVAKLVSEKHKFVNDEMRRIASFGTQQEQSA